MLPRVILSHHLHHLLVRSNLLFDTSVNPFGDGLCSSDVGATVNSFVVIRASASDGSVGLATNESEKSSTRRVC
ncbi:hypothetical protein BLNAU_24803 [Blattamonas nauphoetae]|uniref:Secreted protein n=1 Tax=Blattamonas nauphoetae TaxID=2049346 RepID=A0ABQ9WLF8_9EUKA|nr:hypothetical protein BLNAU_24803 [Blattamonas nauphoetae]